MHVSQRRLPHHYAIGQPLFVTFRLHGSLPPGQYFAADSMRAGEAFAYAGEAFAYAGEAFAYAGEAFAYAGEAFAYIDRRWAVGG